jgi:hypothetical protein
MVQHIDRGEAQDAVAGGFEERCSFRVVGDGCVGEVLGAVDCDYQLHAMRGKVRIVCDPHVQRWQARLNGLNNLMLGGCNLNRDIEQLVRQGGFSFERIDKYYVQGDPKFAGWLTRGLAKPSSVTAA